MNTPATVTGRIFDIKRFALHDGPGIRTSVFLKGCPLRCLWCHNPESISPKTELMFNPAKCTHCMTCVTACPTGAHFENNGTHELDRTRCNGCGACVEGFPSDALELVGETKSVQDILETVRRDKAYYESSGGGMTLSGGEPMMQSEFANALLTAAKEKGLHTCLDTSGYASGKQYLEIAGLVDLFLYDLKHTDPKAHETYTGVPLEPILKNLRLLSDHGASIWLRCPIIPGINDTQEHLRRIGETAEKNHGVQRVTLHPYNPLVKTKTAKLGLTYPLADKGFPSEDEIAAWVATIASATRKEVTTEAG